ncbi:metallophosphoesterase [Mucilaginibacter sp. JRF]|uniref:metallophosphoesterase family protein n=1 Tax=Mucilaginibacter sp. JRF TaxID=2780088 RepID=UPI00187F80B4|nr:metallophosphoesterase [Mucilaginibacter sp. JRF]MBE9586776.1 metallophosphoesterase [Mucilaginibacter sp. JRF]
MQTTTMYRAIFKLNQPDDSHKFQPLPQAAGQYPYHLKHPGEDKDELVFNMVGDTGGFRDNAFQHRVAALMANQAEKPDFLYHLGDVVYHYGEAQGYADQFFKPYEKYSAPIYAIAGNHDGDVNPGAGQPYHSLDAFTTVFCGTEPRDITFSGGSQRKSGIQPNAYWTLDTPLATIIGMYSNVPKYGVVTAEQRAWLVEELYTANSLRPAKAIILAIHHAPYSADINHGCSRPMIELLEGVFAETGIRPDLAVSGHVHNYQRFQKNYDNGTLTYLVAGAGGFDELHPLAHANDPHFSADDPLLDNITLAASQDTRHGFLRISIKKETQGLTLNGAYYTIDPLPENGATLADSFSIVVG